MIDQVIDVMNEDPLLSLVGTWTYGDADSYIDALRDGWDLNSPAFGNA